MIGYYVTVKRDQRSRFLFGPFDTLEQAERNVERGSKLARGYDPWCEFDAFGTCKVTANTLPTGIFNMFGTNP